MLRTFEVTVGGKTYTINNEHFPSLYRLRTDLPKMKTLHHVDDDYLPSNGRNVMSDDRGWCGFRDTEELLHNINYGIMDRAAINRVATFAKMQYIDREVDNIRFDVCGDEVSIERYCQCDLDCMEEQISYDGNDARVRMVIDVGVTCGYSKDSIEMAGRYVARLIRSLELANYAVELIGAGGNYDRCSTVNMLTVDIKYADSAVNYPKLLFLTHPSFFRGLTFSWLAKTRTANYSGLGGQISQSANLNVVQALFSKCFGDKQVVVISLSKVIDQESTIRSKVRNDPKYKNMDNIDRIVAPLVDDYLFRDALSKMKMRF